MSTETVAGGRPPRVYYKKGVRRRREIVAAASSVFAEFGYSGGSIRAIAERVGISPPALLQHFGSKEALLMAVLDDWARQQAALTGEDHPQGLAFIDQMRVRMPFHVLHRGLIELFLTIATEASRLSHPAREFIQERYATSMAEVHQHFRTAIEDGDFRAMSDDLIDREVRTVFAVMDGLELQWLIDPEVDLVRLFDVWLDEAMKRWVANDDRRTSGETGER